MRTHGRAPGIEWAYLDSPILPLLPNQGIENLPFKPQPNAWRMKISGNGQLCALKNIVWLSSDAMINRTYGFAQIPNLQPKIEHKRILVLAVVLVCVSSVDLFLACNQPSTALASSSLLRHCCLRLALMTRSC